MHLAMVIHTEVQLYIQRGYTYGTGEVEEEMKSGIVLHAH